jgi:quercetin dioxygenase-like cupin family protein/uncharacterized protein YndB with AHSA1/START domain
MAKSGELLEMAQMGVRVKVLRTAADTGGEACEFEVIGRARGFLTQSHVHTMQSVRLEPLSGSMKVVAGGRDHVLAPGDVYTVPPGTPHARVPLGEGTVRVTVTPAGDTERFLEKMAELCREGRVLKGGWPRPTAAAELVRDHGAFGHAAKLPVAVQRAVASGILAGAKGGRALREHAGSNEYLFVDEWDVAAPREAVFDALADARTYPQWWTPVYIDVDADGPPVLGKVSRQHFKGRLPYHLHTQSTITRLEWPHLVEGDVEGDLRGRGLWTLTEIPGGTHVRFDWRVFADRKLLRMLTPVLRPVFRWNHNWAIARAMEGLEPYAQRTAQSASAETVALPGLTARG